MPEYQMSHASTKPMLIATASPARRLLRVNRVVARTTHGRNGLKADSLRVMLCAMTGCEQARQKLGATGGS
jgi:hypothetical protein